jgi:P-type Cu2+ transporter
LRSQVGVINVQVNAASGESFVLWKKEQANPELWHAAIERSGYRAVLGRGKDALQLAKQVQKDMLWRWLVAGFCMMQVMMYAWPNYGAQAGDIAPDSDKLLRWASCLLSLPVLQFSSGPFFTGAWRALLQGRVSMDLPIALGILITFGVSSIAAFDAGGPMGKELYFDSLTMFVFILLSGRWVEARLRTSTTANLLSVTQTMPERVTKLLANGQTVSVPLDQLCLGDTVRVLPGAGVPVDGHVVAGQSWVDESVLTGESQAVSKTVGLEVYAGSINLQHLLDIQVTRWANDTRYAKIMQLVEQSVQTKTPTIDLADRIAQPFLLSVLVLCALAWMYWWPTDPHRAWLSCIAVLVVTCPCALALAAPMALLSGAAELARQGVIARDSSAIERLSQIDSVLFDKTGTLSQDQLSVQSCETWREPKHHRAGDIAVALARNSLHPLATALAKINASQPWLTTQHVREFAGKGIEATIQGQTYRLGSWEFCHQEGEEQAQSSIELPQVWLADQQGILACFSIAECFRPDAKEALASLTKMGIHVGILSGDHQASVARAAQTLGLPTQSLLAFSCSPHDKLDALRQTQSQGHHVAMVGDGINDSPALTEAHSSFSLSCASALAQTRADFLLLRPTLQLVPTAIAYARQTMRIVKQNFAWAIVYNLLALPLAFTGWLTPWMAGLGMASSSLIVIANAARLRRFR